MIIDMKKVTLLCLSSETKKVLSDLRDLGVLHAEFKALKSSEERIQMEQKLSSIDRILGLLGARKVEKSSPLESVDGETLLNDIDKLYERETALNKRVDTLSRDFDKLKVWGNFSFDTIDELQKQGVYVYLCYAQHTVIPELQEQGIVEIVNEEKSAAYFVLIAERQLDVSTLPIVALPTDKTLEEIDQELTDVNAELINIAQELDQYVGAMPILERYRATLAEEHELAKYEDGMSEDKNISYIQGYVPVPEIDALKTAALNKGWALSIEEPAEDDMVPTLTEVPKMFRIIEPIFDFLGISPGYNETDVSIPFLLFFIIFFAMIIGDAGYGALFLLIALGAKVKLKDNPQAKLPVNLFIVLSSMTILWGGITGNWFGISAPGWKPLTDPSTKDQSVQLLCFILAALHLTTGRVWQGLLSGKVTSFLGQLGWVLVIWGNFVLTLKLIVFPGDFPTYMFYLYGIGFPLVALFNINWKDPGDVFNFPFGAIGSFVDVLSYIRLFAVGMAGFCIASSFNGMAADVAGLMPPVGIIGAVIIALFGHALNIALCLMGVLVHGIRLNTLEFSNHVGLQWAGLIYNPLKKQTNNNNKNNEGE